MIAHVASLLAMTSAGGIPHSDTSGGIINKTVVNNDNQLIFLLWLIIIDIIVLF